jgi:hypothetical protein
MGGDELGGVRACKRIPARYVLIGRHQGGVGLQVYRNASYVGKRSVAVIVDYDANRTPVAATVEGTVRALCR